MLSRRDMVGKLAAGTAAVLAVGAARKGLASTRREANSLAGSGHGEDQVTPAQDLAETASGPVGPIVDSDTPATATAPAPWELLRPLAMGSAVAHGWHVAGLSGVVDGSGVVTLQNERGRTHRVHICRNDGRPQGLVYTNQFDLVVMNGGQGDLPTEEGLAQAVAELAHVLATNESRQEAVVASLLPQAERVRLFQGSVDRRLR